MQISAFVTSLAAFVATASGHVSLNPPTGAASSYVVTSVRVPHSFAGAVTKNVTVVIPDGIVSVKPQQVDEWKVDFEYKLVNGTNAVSKVTWYGGSLPDELYQDFGLQMKLSDLPANTVLYFPVIQWTTPNGTLAWNSTPDAAGKLADPAHPAPKFTVTKKA